MNYSEKVESLLSAGQKVASEGEAIALVELSDCSRPHLIIDVLGRDGRFKTIFEKELMVKEVLDGLHLPVLLRVSMYGQPVGAKPDPTEGNSIEGKSLQSENPEQRRGILSESTGRGDGPA